MGELILVGCVFALGVAIARGAGRMTGLDRDMESLRLRVAGVEMALSVAVQERPFQRPAAVPRADVPPARTDLPPEGGSYSIEREEAEAKDAESLETVIGSRWLLYIGIVAIVIGAAYFEKLAIDNRWLGETARIVQGAVVGLLAVYAGLRFVRAGYAVYGQMIAGGGAAILYLSTFAAFNFYQLMGRPLAFTLMIGITALVTWLADRLRSQGLAIFAVGGGFATPFSTGTTDAQIALFGYDTILIGGTMALSHRRSWPVLNIVSYAFTVLTVAAWADRFYAPEKYLRTEIFITLFCGMFLYLRHRMRKLDGASRLWSAVLWTAPAAYYLASLLILQDHGAALLVWLVALMTAGGALSERAGMGAGLAVWAAVTAPLLLWTVTHLNPRWQTDGLTTIAAVYLIALAAQLRRAFADPDRVGNAGVAWLHLNGLLMGAAAFFLLYVSHAAATGPLTAVFAAWQGVLAAATARRRRDEALHFAALGFTLLSIAIALQFDGPAVTIGWAVEGAVVIALGMNQRRDWLRAAGVVLFTVAFGQTMAMLWDDRPVGEIVFFNPHAAAAATIAALSYALAWLHYRDPGEPDRELGIGASLVMAQAVTLALLTSEIHSYWALREGPFARELMVSVTWGVYATALIVVGLQKRYAPIRYVAMIVFAATILKVFAFDMAELERIYRVSSVIGLGILLLVTSYLYSRSKRPEGRY